MPCHWGKKDLKTPTPISEKDLNTPKPDEEKTKKHKNQIVKRLKYTNLLASENDGFV